MSFEVSLGGKHFFANMAFIFFMGESWYSFDGAKLSQSIFFCKVVVVVVVVVDGVVVVFVVDVFVD